MGAAQGQPVGPDLTQGIASEELGEGRMLAGHVGEDAVLLARSGNEIFAVDAKCSHYGGPLADGLLVGTTVRCPWHHGARQARTAACRSRQRYAIGAAGTPALGQGRSHRAEKRNLAGTVAHGYDGRGRGP